MSIHEIFTKGIISQTSYDICKENGFNNIFELRKFYNDQKAFHQLKNCEITSHLELVKACSLDIEEEEKITSKPETHLEIINVFDEEKKAQLHNFFELNYNKLSVRSRNALRRHFRGKPCVNIFTFTFLDSQKFRVEQIKNVGIKSEEEIDSLITSIKNYILNLINYQDDLKEFDSEEYEIAEKKDSKQSIGLISTFTETEKAVLENYFKLRLADLPVRASNALNNHFNGKLTAEVFISIFLEKTLPISKIKNVGKKTIIDLENFMIDITSYIQKINTSEDKGDLAQEGLKLLLIKKVPDTVIPETLLANPSIFGIIDFLWKKNGIFENKAAYILLGSTEIYNNIVYKSLDAIAEEINLTRERVRQIRVKSLEKLKTKFSFLREINDGLFSHYGLETNQKVIIITDEIAAKINFESKTFFTKNFIALILSIYLDDGFSPIGDYREVLIPLSPNSKTPIITNLYLIKKDEKNNFNFQKFLGNIKSRLDSRIYETYSLPLKGFISQFCLQPDPDFINQILPICEALINEECKMVPDIDDNLVFERNTRKNNYEYAYEALEKLDKPSKVKDIVEEIHRQYPDYHTNIDQARASMKRSKGFVPVGRKSVYGLKKWQKEKENFKGGTIRSITEEFLQDFDEPQHISVITEHIVIFRPKTNERSIITNLKIEEHDTFTFFKNYHVGLSSKNYNEKKFLQLNKINSRSPKSWEESYESLTNFTEEYARLPKSTMQDEEVELYRWFSVQKSKMNNGTLSTDKLLKIIELIKKFPSKK